MSFSDSFTFEHVAFNADDYQTVVQWYVENLGLRVVRETPGQKAFLGDSSGRIVLELYANSTAPVLDLKNTHHLSVHIAFTVSDPDGAAEKLVSAGATLIDPPKSVEGDRLVMLQDPFGMSLQLIKRRDPM